MPVSHQRAGEICAESPPLRADDYRNFQPRMVKIFELRGRQGRYDLIYSTFLGVNASLPIPIVVDAAAQAYVSVGPAASSSLIQPSCAGMAAAVPWAR